MSYLDYLKTERFPHTWCAGCGNGMVLSAIARAFSELQLDPTKTVVVTGIGCWGKADDFIRTSGFHGAHGRALAYATGIKLANPELTVVVLMGDGDGVTIGGNHFIHAARRNIDVTAIVVNNLNYGMTGGQYSGTTPEDYYTATSPYGHIESHVDICGLAVTAGANFAARTLADSGVQLTNLIKDGISRKGFSVIEALSPCPAHFGKLNGMKSTPEMLDWMKKNSVSLKQAKNMSEYELEGKFVLGVFSDRNRIDYGTSYQKVIAKAKEAAADE